MYESFFGLKERPFNLTPDTRFLYLSEKHKEAFAHLLFGIKNRTGFVMVSGEVGTGKTTICRTLLKRLEENVEVAFIFNPMLSPVELLRKINDDFGIDSSADTTRGLTDELNRFLLESYRAQKNCVLLIDEAQDLEPNLLEQIRLLSNLETETQKLLQIVLVGQPELIDLLELPELRQLDQRITARYHLDVLSEHETLQYIAYRIRVAGGRRKIRFTPRAVRHIYKASGGTPRMINAFCDRALLVAYTEESRDITLSMARRAVHEVSSRQDGRRSNKQTKIKENKSPSRFRQYMRMTLVAALVIAVLGGAQFAPTLWSYMRNQTEPSGIDNPITTPPHTERANTVIAESREDLIPHETVTQDGNPEDTTYIDSIVPHIVQSKLESLSVDETLRAAVAGILRAWNRALITLPQETNESGLAEYAQEYGLDAEVLSLSLEQIYAINLPMLVRVNGGDKPHWLALIHFENDSLHLTGDNTSQIETTTDEFRRIYDGKAVIYWKDPTPDARTLFPGESGSEVTQLQQWLHAAGRLQASQIGHPYGPATETAVRALQAETGLKEDGIAGRQVRLVLSSWLNDTTTPSLRKRSHATDQEQAPPVLEVPAKPASTASTEAKSTPETIEMSAVTNKPSVDITKSEPQPVTQVSTASRPSDQQPFSALQGEYPSFMPETQANHHTEPVQNNVLLTPVVQESETQRNPNQ